MKCLNQKLYFPSDHLRKEIVCGYIYYMYTRNIALTNVSSATKVLVSLQVLTNT